MASLSANQEPGVESELIDLGTLSMAVLRKSNDTVLRQAVRHVMEQTGRPPATAEADQSGRVD